jgi:hypothetical protein
VPSGAPALVGAFTFLGGRGGGGGLGRLLRKSVSTWSGSDVGFTPESTDCRCARFVNYIVWILSFVKFLTAISDVDGEAHGRKSAGAHARSRQRAYEFLESVPPRPWFIAAAARRWAAGRSSTLRRDCSRASPRRPFLRSDTTPVPMCGKNAPGCRLFGGWRRPEGFKHSRARLW